MADSRTPRNLRPEEPDAGPWTETPLRTLVDELRSAGGPETGRPVIVAIDGRGASGKSTLAARIHAAVPASAIVHTDDLAWHEPYFAWEHLLADGVLAPLHAGLPVDFRPPAWDRKGRTGSVSVPADLDLVLVEGTGSGHRDLAATTDVLVWVQSDAVEAERRGIARDVAEGVNGDLAAATAFWHDWMASEIAFLENQRPWERADLLVDGTPSRAAVGDALWTARPAPHR